MNKTARRGIAVFLCLCALIFAFRFHDKLLISAKGLFILTAKGAGNWGSFWWFLLTGAGIYGLIRIIPSYLPESGGQGSGRPPQNERGTELLLFVIAAFMAARVVLYSVGDIPAEALWYLSGNRMLLHIYPVGVYFLGRAGAWCTGEITDRHCDMNGRNV